MITHPILLTTLIAMATTLVAADTHTTAIHNQNDFCFFMPPQPGLSISANRQNGVPFCLKQNSVPGSQVFPEGFITTAHYAKSQSYEQVTGFFDRTKYKLDASDVGGQYDNHAKGRPIGGQCEGYKYFVSLVEPHLERFCIRCCHNEEDCMTGRSKHGCLRVISGDYTRTNNMITKDHTNTNINSVYHDLDTLVNQPKEITVNQAIATKVATLQTQLKDAASLHSVQSEWDHFLGQLAHQHLSIAGYLHQLQILSSALSTVDQYQAYFKVVAEKIQTISTSTTNTPTNTHTNTREDLEWLFEHHKNHDNQATW